jgi:hypothetical protein
VFSHVQEDSISRKVEKKVEMTSAPFDFLKKRIAAFPANAARPDGLITRLSMTGTAQMVLQNTGTTRKAGWSTQTGVMTMKTVKIHVFAAVIALALSTGAAMAQEGGSTYPVAPDYWAPKAAAGTVAIQSGSSDVTPVDPLHSIPAWRDLPTYGGRG